MGVVYEVRSPGIPVSRALKLLPLGPEPEDLVRFRREAELLARIDHPGIVRIHEVGSAPEGHFLVMDLVPGTSLEDVLRTGPVPAERAQSWILELCAAVEALHAAGILHRDLKPANVVLRPDGRLVILDFGLARSAGRSSLTQSGAIAGSPGYLAPEQAHGQRDLTPACDVHGLGAVWYALLTGEAPFRGPTVLAALASVVQDVPKWPAGLAPAVEAVGRRALAKDSSERYSTASEFGSALLAAGEPGARARPWGLALAALALAIGSLGVFAWWRAEQLDEAPGIKAPQESPQIEPSERPSQPGEPSESSLSFLPPPPGRQRALWYRQVWENALGAQPDPRAAPALEFVQGAPLWEVHRRRPGGGGIAVPWGRLDFALAEVEGATAENWTTGREVRFALQTVATENLVSLASCETRLLAFRVMSSDEVYWGAAPGASLDPLPLPGLQAGTPLLAACVGPKRIALATPAQVLVYDRDMQLVEELEAHDKETVALAFLSSGELVAAGRKGVLSLGAEIRGLRIPVVKIAAHPLDPIFAVGCQQGVLWLGGSPLGELKELRVPLLQVGDFGAPSLEGIEFGRGREVLWSVQGSTRSNMGAISLWTRSGSEWKVARTHDLGWCPTHLVSAAEGAWLLVSGQEGRLELWPGVLPPELSKR